MSSISAQPAKPPIYPTGQPLVFQISQRLDLPAGCSFRYYVTGPVPSVHRLPEIIRPKLSARVRLLTVFFW